jgi:hypothetical protein
MFLSAQVVTFEKHQRLQPVKTKTSMVTTCNNKKHQELQPVQIKTSKVTTCKDKNIKGYNL